MPRDTWQIEVNVSGIGDLSDMATLGLHGITEILPTLRSAAQTPRDVCETGDW